MGSAIKSVGVTRSLGVHSVKNDNNQSGTKKNEETSLRIALYNTIQYKHEYFYGGINPVEFRGYSKRLIIKTIGKHF